MFILQQRNHYVTQVSSCHFHMENTLQNKTHTIKHMYY